MRFKKEGEREERKGAEKGRREREERKGGEEGRRGSGENDCFWYMK